jgi:hypothetical protein
MQTNPIVQNMSTKELERTIYDIMTDEGMDEEEADEKIDSMERHDLEEYLSPYYDEE